MSHVPLPLQLGGLHSVFSQDLPSYPDLQTQVCVFVSHPSECSATHGGTHRSGTGTGVGVTSLDPFGNNVGALDPLLLPDPPSPTNIPAAMPPTAIRSANTMRRICPNVQNGCGCTCPLEVAGCDGGGGVGVVVFGGSFGVEAEVPEPERNREPCLIGGFETFLVIHPYRRYFLS